MRLTAVQGIEEELGRVLLVGIPNQMLSDLLAAVFSCFGPPGLDKAVAMSAFSVAL